MDPLRCGLKYEQCGRRRDRHLTALRSRTTRGVACRRFLAEGRSVATDDCDRAIPADLEIHYEPRRPETDPTLGVRVAVPDGPEPKHRLVTIGDSITQGF